MASIFDLPLELELQVLRHLPPLDAFNFAISSKSRWDRAASVLEEHRQLYNRWRKISLSELDSEVHNPASLSQDELERARESTSAWSYFQAICEDPRIAFHVREMRYTPDFEASDPSTERIERCCQAAKGSSATAHLPFDWVEQCINGDDPTSMFYMLLCLCPEVTSISYSGEVDLDEAGQILHFLEEVISRTGRIPHTTLAKLKSAYLTHRDTSGGFDAKLCQVLISLPSMRSFTGHLMAGGGTSVSDTPTSNITALEFNYSCFDSSVLESLLSRISALESFKYEHGGGFVSDEDYDPIGFTSMLAKYSAHSLELLELVNSDDWRYYLGERGEMYKPFSKLRTLFVDHLDFFNPRVDSIPESPGSESSQHTLPVTIERLKIGSYLPGSLESLTFHEFVSPEDLGPIIEEKQTHIPHLRRLTVYGPEQYVSGREIGPMTAVLIDECVESAKARGVEIVYRRHSHKSPG